MSCTLLSIFVFYIDSPITIYLLLLQYMLFYKQHQAENIKALA